MRLLRSLAPLLLLLLPPLQNLAPAADHRPGRVVVVVVWDGLRADAPNLRDTPHLMALMHEGTNFLHHHSMFPTLTMVNAAGMATGATPGATGILGNSMYVENAPAGNLSANPPEHTNPSLALLDLLDPAVLRTLDPAGSSTGSQPLASSFAQAVLRAGGYVAVIGSAPPGLFLHNRAADHSAIETKQQPLVIADRPDASSMSATIRRALPAAEAASLAGRPALIILWQNEPDHAEHSAGLGTLPVRTALRRSDDNLGRLRHALVARRLLHRTDLIVVSDHGCATLKLAVRLSDLLVTAGLKRSLDSDDIVVARNGGVDLVYLSPQVFPTVEARRAMLARIVDFAAAQDWCGAIFSHAGPPPGTSTADKNLGWIPGTFSQQLIGIYNADRSPDLFISFREVANNNRGLTGPASPAFALGSRGQIAVRNHSSTLLEPVIGVVYADTAGNHFTTGMGMHGAAGQYEIHSFLTAAGPDFKSHFSDPNPTGNLDLAPTLRTLLDLPAAPSQTGRVLTEALTARDATLLSDSSAAVTSPTAYLVLQGAQIESQLHLTSFAGETYLDDTSVSRAPIGPPQ